MLFRVPGDGDFTITNTKAALKQFAEIIQKFPTTKPSQPGGGNLRETESTIPPVGKTISLGQKTLNEVLGRSVSTDDARASIQVVFSDGAQMVATDGSHIIRIKTNLGGGTPETPVFRDAKGAVVPNEDVGTFPAFDQLFTKESGAALVFKDVDTGRLIHLLHQARAALNEKSQLAVLWRNADGSYGISAEVPGESSYSHNVQRGARNLSGFQVGTLLKVLKAARISGADKVDISKTLGGDNLNPLVVKSPGFDALVMPWKNDAALNKTALTSEHLAAPLKKSALDRADDALADKIKKIRKQGRAGGVFGADPEFGALVIARGAIKIVKGARTFAKWSTEMISDFGDMIRPRLRSIWVESMRAYNGKHPQIEVDQNGTVKLGGKEVDIEQVEAAPETPAPARAPTAAPVPKAPARGRAAEPTPGTKESVRKYGFMNDAIRSVNAVAAARKPVLWREKKAVNHPQLGMLAKRARLKRHNLSNGDIAYARPTDSGDAAVRRLDLAIQAKDPQAIGRALGYREDEIASFTAEAAAPPPPTPGAPPPGERPAPAPATPRAAPGAARPPGVPPPATPAEGGAATAFPSGETRMRNLAARATQSPDVPEPVRQRIGVAVESFYPRQSVPEVVAYVRSLTGDELSAITPRSEVYTAAKLEQANRLFRDGQNDAGFRIIEELAAEATRYGQLINQAKLLQGLLPESIVGIVNKRLELAKRDPLTPEQTDHLIGLSRDRALKQIALDNVAKQWRREPTDANARLAEEALKRSNQAALEEQRFVHKFTPKSWPALLKSILQGNLLTPMSESANLIGNVSFVPFRMLERSIAANIDFVDAAIRNRPREVLYHPLEGTREMIKGIARGLAEIPAILRHGSGDTIKGEKRAGLHPITALKNVFKAMPEVPTRGGKVPITDRMKMLVEGLPGMPAEIMLRGLAAGDIPAMRAARARIIAEQASLHGIRKEHMHMAQLFPELVFDKATRQIIEAETARSVFQRESDTVNYLNRLLRRKPEVVDLIVSTVIPYKLTPWNIISEIMSFNPAVASVKALSEAYAGNVRATEMALGRAAVGGLLTGVGYLLYQNGLIAPSLDQRDEAQKARILSGTVLPPNHINISGIKRYMMNQDPSFRPGDDTRDVFRAGGLAGAMFYMVANIGRDIEKKAAEPEDMIWSLFRNSVIEQARFGVNQSFLKGMSSLLQSITTGETDNVVQGWLNSVVSIPIPNTLAVIGRARRDYKVEVRGETFGKSMSNMIRFRLGEKNLDDYMTLRRGLWGEPLPETPKDRNAFMYWFFDITKGQHVTDDPVPLELYRLWRKTGDTKAIPSLPELDMTVGRVRYQLTPAQKSREAQLIGEFRRSMIDELIVNPNYHKLHDERRIQLLDRVWAIGQMRGKMQFFKETRGQLKIAPTKPGYEAVPPAIFQPPPNWSRSNASAASLLRQ